MQMIVELTKFVRRLGKTTPLSDIIGAAPGRHHIPYLISVWPRFLFQHGSITQVRRYGRTRNLSRGSSRPQPRFAVCVPYYLSSSNSLYIRGFVDFASHIIHRYVGDLLDAPA